MLCYKNQVLKSIINKFILFYLYFLPVFSLAETPVLTIYAPDYFVSEWGPGPKIEQEFEKKCNCDLKFIPGEPLSRVMLEGKSTNADILLGLSYDNIHLNFFLLRYFALNYFFVFFDNLKNNVREVKTNALS